jgi:hypothetical protein
MRLWGARSTKTGHDEHSIREKPQVEIFSLCEFHERRKGLIFFYRSIAYSIYGSVPHTEPDPGLICLNGNLC